MFTVKMTLLSAVVATGIIATGGGATAAASTPVHSAHTMLAAYAMPTKNNDNGGGTDNDHSNHRRVRTSSDGESKPGGHGRDGNENIGRTNHAPDDQKTNLIAKCTDTDKGCGGIKITDPSRSTDRANGPEGKNYDPCSGETLVACKQEKSSTATNGHVTLPKDYKPSGPCSGQTLAACKQEKSSTATAIGSSGE
jgi:hypothetical protein